jgi:hypothetical protein
VEVDSLPAIITDADGNEYEVREGENGTAIVIEEVVIQGFSDNYEVVINEETEPATTDRKVKLVYEQQELNLRLQKNNGDSIRIADIQWEIKNGNRKETADSTLVRDITVSDRNVEVAIYETIKDKTGKFKKVKVADFDFIVRQSPYITFSTLSGYDGEFGFDDGEDFEENSVAKLRMHYDTIHVADTKNKTKILYAPWLTLRQGQTAELQVKLSKEIDGDSIYVETSDDDIIARYDKMQKNLFVTNNTLSNNFNSPSYISFFRNDKYGLQKEMLIGKCAAVSMAQFKPIDVQIIHFAKDTSNFKNSINTAQLQTLLNSNSLNQAFVRFNVLPTIMNIKDTLNGKQKEDYLKAYDNIRDVCKNKGIVITTDQRPMKIYVVLTELKFSTTDGDKITEKGGGVRDKSNLAIMWSIENTKEEKEKMIIHEIGHTLGLNEAFKETYANTIDGKGQSGGFSRHNYMDYNIIRKMFFVRQIQIIISNLNNEE